MLPRRIPITFAWLSATIIAIAAQAAAGSDGWIVTDQDLIAEDQPLWISLVAGDTFPFSATALTTESVTTHAETTAAQSIPIAALSQQDGALSRRRTITNAGFHIFTATLAPEFVERPTETPEADTQTETIADVAEQSDDAAPDATVTIEKRLRFAKTIIGVLPLAEDDTAFASPVGQPFEIVPLSRPTDWRRGDTVHICILLDGYAWPDVAITARCTAWSDDRPAIATETDSRGIAAIPLECAGHWCITAQLTRPATGIGRADRETLCSTLSFRAGDETDVNRALQTVRAEMGKLTPEALLGYRMGQCAIHTLSLPTNSRSLAIYHQTPQETPADGIARGICVAVRPDGGDVSMRQETSSNHGMMTVFSDRLANRQVVVQVLPSVLQWLREMSPEEMESASLRLAAMPDDEVFAATLMEPSPHPTPAGVPWDEITETVAVDVRPASP